MAHVSDQSDEKSNTNEDQHDAFMNKIQSTLTQNKDQHKSNIPYYKLLCNSAEHHEHMEHGTKIKPFQNVGALFVIISILIMIYACTVGYVCCLCFQRTRYDIKFNQNTKIVEVWSSSNKLFAEQEIPFGHIKGFKMEVIEQQRVVYGNPVKGSYQECAVIYVETLHQSLVRINKYFAVGDEIDHARHMIERLNKYWLKDRFCRRLNA